MSPRKSKSGSSESPPAGSAQTKGSRLSSPKRLGTSSGSRFPVALKFALFITALVVVFMWIATAIAMHTVAREQNAGVNASGTRVVSILTDFIDPAWLEGDEDREIDRKRLESVLGDVLEATRELGVLNALVKDPSEEFLLATGRREVVFQESRQKNKIDSELSRRVGVLIREFEYEGDLVRSFRHPIRRSKTDSGPDGNGAQQENERKGEILGYAEIFLSGAQIEESRLEVRNQLITLSILTCLLAAVGSLVIGSLLARPIHTLVKDLRQVSLGNLDHQSGVKSADELGDLARTFNQMTENLKKAQSILVVQKATEHELNLATKIQRGLLPTAGLRIPGFEVSSFYESAREVGGDYYDFVPIDTGHTGLVVADVSGKGIPGSLVMIMTRSLLRLAARGVTSPAVTVRRVNRAISPDMNRGMFVTLLYLVLHHADRTAQIVRAGHTPAIYFNARTSKLTMIQPRGIALGLDPSGGLFESDLEVQQVSFQRDDFLVAFTDGIIEAKNGSSEDYGMERLAKILREHSKNSAQGILDAVIRDVREFTGEADQADDITFLVAKYTGEA